MRLLVRCLILPGLALLLASCANSAKLAQQSNEALAKGDLRKAYDRARSAIEKDPQNQDARDAYAAASRQVAADLRQRVVALAVADTLAAADLALELRQVRLEVARHQTAFDAAPGYDSAERAILAGAARGHYQRGADAMAAHRPKLAVEEFTLTRRYDDGFADVALRLDAAREAATARVALLPFSDGIGVPGLSQEIGDSVQHELSRRAGREFRFTQLIGADEIERNMTVAMARNLQRDDALALGRRVGAHWVVVGRFLGLRSNNSQRELALPLYHRVDAKDDKGAAVVRWEESSLQIVTRERDVTVQYDFDVLDVASGAVLAHGEEPARARVRVAWSDYRPGEDFDRYALLPPDVRKNDPARARKVDAQWREQMGSWNLGDVLRQAREQRARTRYTSRYRGEFYGDTRARPVWMGELPSENELAFVALHDVWRGVLAALKELDVKN
mgnify:CR=1 FL=1